MITRLNANLKNALWIYDHIFDNQNHEAIKNLLTSRYFFIRWIKCLFIIAKRVIDALDYRINENKLSLKKEHIVLYGNSGNSLRTLKFLIKDNGVIFLSQSRTHQTSKSNKVAVHHIKKPIWLIVLTFFNFPIFAVFYWKKAFKYPEFYFANWGTDYVNRKLLKKYPHIQTVIFSNDHSINDRLFFFACKELGLKTIYLQHSSVSLNFPPLSFDESYLMGKVDYEKYFTIGIKRGVAQAVGAPMFDDLYKFRRDNSSNYKKTIGVALNQFDERIKIELLINHLIVNTSYNIKVRLHPGDERKPFIQSERISWKSAKEETLLDYFNSISFQISGESSIHLESVYMNIPSYYYCFGKGIMDYYDFMKNNVIEQLNLEDISDYWLNQIQLESSNIYMKTKPYIESVNTEIDGNVGNFLKRRILR